MFRRLLIFVYFQIIGMIKIAEEQIFKRQRKLHKEGNKYFLAPVLAIFKVLANLSLILKFSSFPQFNDKFKRQIVVWIK